MDLRESGSPGVWSCIPTLRLPEFPCGSHPHPEPPLEGEGERRSLPLQRTEGGEVDVFLHEPGDKGDLLLVVRGEERLDPLDLHRCRVGVVRDEEDRHPLLAGVGQDVRRRDDVVRQEAISL